MILQSEIHVSCEFLMVSFVIVIFTEIYRLQFVPRTTQADFQSFVSTLSSLADFMLELMNWVGQRETYIFISRLIYIHF